MSSKLRNKVYLFIVFGLIGCASTHPGRLGKSIDPDNPLPIRISAKTIQLDEADPFDMLEITIENTSSDWLRISKGEVLIDNPEESKISAVVGRDLTDWANSMKSRMDVKNYNKDIAKTALLGGAYGLLASDDPKVRTAGAVLGLGTSVWIVSDAIKVTIDEVEKAEKIPENHLHHAVSIPGKMFQRRWILLNRPSGQHIDNLAVQFETIDGKKSQYVIKI